MPIEIHFTADVITYDDSDTNSCGEPCEPGGGYTEASGWWAPTFSATTISDDPEYADTFTYDPSDDETPAEFIARTIQRYCGAVESNGDGTFYAVDSIRHYSLPHDVRPAAHVAGATPEDLDAACDILDGRI